VDAGSRNLNYLKPYSCAFTEYGILDSSEMVIQPHYQDYIRFVKPLKAGESRLVWFIIGMNPYGAAAEEIDYELRAGRTLVRGKIMGPICTNQFKTQVTLNSMTKTASLALITAVVIFLRGKIPF
jgi:hypothetical protein